MGTKITGTNTAAAPGVTGDDTDTGLFYGTNEIGLSTGGTERLRIAASGQVGIAGANYGSTGQVLTSGGSGGSVSWSTPTEYDDTNIRKDIAKLALQIAVDTNRAAYNLTNTFIDQFESDSGIGTETNTDRNASEYVGSAQTTAFRYLKFQYTNASSNGYPKVYETTFYPQASAGGTAISNSGITGSMVTGSEHSNSNGVAAAADGNESTFVQIDTGTANVAFKLDFGSGVAHYIGSVKFKHQQHNLVSNIQLLGSNNDSDYTSIASWAGTNSGYFLDNGAGGAWTGAFDTAYPVNATGSMISTANTASSSRTKVSGVMIYKNQAGTATLGTDLKIYFTCNGGTNWTEAASYTAGSDFSSGIKTVYLGEATCTSGTDIRYKVEFANQSAGSKETQLHGIGVNY